MRIRRDYDLLGRAAKRIYPVTSGEKRCRHEQEAMGKVRKRVEERIYKHFCCVDDGLVIRVKP